MPKPQKPNAVRSNAAEHEQRDQQRERIEKNLLGSKLKSFEKKEAHITRDFHSSYEKLNQRLNQTDKAAQHLDQRLGKFANAGVDQAAVDKLLNQTAASLYQNMPTPPKTRPFAQKKSSAASIGKTQRTAPSKTKGYSNTGFSSVMKQFDRIPTLKSRTAHSEDDQWAKLEQQADRELVSQGTYLDRAAFKDATRLTAKDRQEIRQEYQAMKTEALVSEVQAMTVPARAPVVDSSKNVSNAQAQPAQNLTVADKIAAAARLKKIFEAQLEEQTSPQNRQVVESKIARCDRLLNILQTSTPEPQQQTSTNKQPVTVAVAPKPTPVNPNPVAVPVPVAVAPKPTPVNPNPVPVPVPVAVAPTPTPVNPKPVAAAPKPTPASKYQTDVQAFRQAVTYTSRVSDLNNSLLKTTRRDGVLEIEKHANHLKGEIQSDLTNAKRDKHSAAVGVLNANFEACSKLVEYCQRKLKRRSPSDTHTRRFGMR